jgi:hypothetical protein
MARNNRMIMLIALAVIATVGIIGGIIYWNSDSTKSEDKKDVAVVVPTPQ